MLHVVSWLGLSRILFDHLALLYSGYHGDYFSGEEPGGESEYEDDATEDEDKVEVGNGLYFVGFVGAEGHLLSAIDELVVLMLVGDRVDESGIFFNFFAKSEY